MSSSHNQSNPSVNPFPFDAELSIIVHFLSRISVRPRASEIFAPFKAPGISCLFAKTNNVVPFSSSSYSLSITITSTFRMADNSAFATLRRSISALSTTKITASSDHTSILLLTCIREVTSPKGTNTRLAAQIPHLECQILIFQCLNVETNGRYCGHNFVQLHAIYM